MIQSVLLSTEPTAHVEHSVPPVLRPQADLVTQQLVRMMFYRFIRCRGKVVLHDSAHLGDDGSGPYPIPHSENKQVYPLSESFPQAVIIRGLEIVRLLRADSIHRRLVEL